MIQGIHHHVRAHMAVIRQQRADIAQAHVFVIGAIVPRQYQPTMTCKRRMVQDVLDTVIDAQMAVSHGFSGVGKHR